MYNVLVFAKMLVEDYFHLDLLRRESTLLKCMFLVDELDGNDRFRLVVRYCLTYSGAMFSPYVG